MMGFRIPARVVDDAVDAPVTPLGQLDELAQVLGLVTDPARPTPPSSWASFFGRTRAPSMSRSEDAVPRWLARTAAIPASRASNRGLPRACHRDTLTQSATRSRPKPSATVFFSRSAHFGASSPEIAAARDQCQSGSQ